MQDDYTKYKKASFVDLWLPQLVIFAIIIDIMIKELKKKFTLYALALFGALVCVCMVLGFCMPKQSFDTYADNGQANLFLGDVIDNNVLFFSFNGEQQDLQSLTPHKSLYETFETYFVTGDYSVKSYYDLNSNYHLDVNTPIIKDQDQNLKVFETQKPRTYYLPYIVEYNGIYYKNPNGYFDYYLVSSASAPKDAYLPTFFEKCTLVAKVYLPSGTSIGEDRNISDGIISYDYANELASSDSKVYLVSSYERMFREYELFCDIMTKASSYLNSLTSDQNNDGILDSLSIALLDGESAQGFYSTSSKYNSYYNGQLLWPHKVPLKLMYNNFGVLNPTKKEYFVEKFQNLGYTQEDANLIVGYLYDMPKTSSDLFFDTVSFVNMNATRLSGEEGWNNFVTDNSTFCHEFGHVLGLPDLYTDTGNFNLVGSYSQMCNNPQNNSFFTSYEREKLGWLNSNNIKEITSQGLYTLKRVEGADQDNIVAYKVKDPTNSSRYLYMEYRSADGEYYDTSCGKSGLVLYSVDTSRAKQGNQGGLPYEIYVQRLPNDTVSNAGLGSGQTMSNIIFDYGGTNVKSGLVVSVRAVGEDYLTFSISGGSLDNTQRVYTKADFANNQRLYDKLVAALPENVTVLSQNCFSQNTILELSDCGISDLSFLALFNLSSLNYLNLAHNQITNQNFSSFYTSAFFEDLLANSSPKVILSGNYIDLFNLSYMELLDQHITYGVQFYDFDFVNFNQARIVYYVKSTDAIVIKVNNQALDINSSEQVYSQNGQYQIEESVNLSGLSKVYTTTFYVVDATSKYPDYSSVYSICKNDEFSENIEDYLQIDGVSADVLEYEYTLPSTSQAVEVDSFDINVYYNSKYFTTCTVYYSIYDVPTVVYNSGKDFYVSSNSIFEEKGISVYKDGQKQNYQMNNTLENKTYFVKGYYTGVTFDANDNPNFENATEVNEVDTSVLTTYVVWYYLTDEYGKHFDFYNQIIVTDKLIEKREMNINIYNALLAISGKNAVIVDAFKDFDYLNLVGINTQSTKGLELLELKDDVVIDLSNNTLTDITEIVDIMNCYPSATLVLIANKFSRQDILTLSGLLRARAVFGVQNLQKTVFNTSVNQIVYVADYYDDFSSYYTMSSQAQMTQTNLYYTEYGQYYNIFERNDNSARFVLSCNYFGIINKNTNVTKEYSQTFDENLSTYFNIYGVSGNLLNYTSNSATLELNVLGVKTVLFTVSYFNYSIVVSQQITVVDTTKPQITFVGDANVYVTDLQQYYSSYADVTVSAFDEYDGELEVEQSDNLQNEIGLYQVTYFATDHSGNKGVFTRNVYIGKCELSSNGDIINVNGNTPLPVKFTVFSIDDFNISYKLQSETSFVPYTSQVGIVCRNLGSYVYNIKLVNKYNSSVSYNFEYSVLCKDIQAPTIEILGESEISLFMNERYTESGIRVTDNYIQGVFDLENQGEDIQISCAYSFVPQDGEEMEVESVDTSKVGTYTITYKAVDTFGNQSTNQRVINVLYYRVKTLSIDTENLKSGYKVGKTVSFRVKVGPENVDPKTKIVWYVNDEEYATTNGFTLDIHFDKEGEYTIYTLDTSTNVKSEKVSIKIYNNSGMILIIAIASGTVLLAGGVVVAIVIIKRKKKREA